MWCTSQLELLSYHHGAAEGSCMPLGREISSEATFCLLRKGFRHKAFLSYLSTLVGTMSFQPLSCACLNNKWGADFKKSYPA